VRIYARYLFPVLVGALAPLLGSSALGSTMTSRIKPSGFQHLSPVQKTALEAFGGPDLHTKTGPMHKVGYELTNLFYVDLLSPPLATAKAKPNGPISLPLSKTADGRDFVLVDATANGDVQLLRSRLLQLGAKNLSASPPIVSGWVPVKALDQIAAIDSLRFLRPSRAVAQTGIVVSQGDFAIRGPSLRPPAMPFGPTGSGITVGAISDSYNCLGGAGADISDGEFPNGVTVIREQPGCVGAISISGTDEGRAMLQIVADVAPDSSLLFASGDGGIAAFANSVTSLADSGARVIVDDLWYFASPWFQDGVINAAIDDAVLNKGAAYFSAAGNYSSASYESAFSPSTSLPGFHDFDPSAGTDRPVSAVYLESGQTAIVLMQWDQPFASACTGCPGSQSDIDIYFVSATDGSVIGIPGIDDNIGGDPYENALVTNPGVAGWFYFVIERFAGPSPGLIKLIYLDLGLTYLDVTESSTLVGPGRAANAIAVGAADFFETPACGTSPTLAQFSSRGGSPTLFSATGARLATAVVRQKPEIVAPQGGNTSFFGQDIPSQPGSSTLAECLDGDGLPNFFGTSAAAPHAAGVAALLLSAVPTLTPQQLYDGMKLSATDMMGVGFDFDSGYGLLQADAAFALLADTTPVGFSFTSKKDVKTGVQITSNTVTITGINTPTLISVAGGTYAIGCLGNFTATSGTISNGQTVCVRHISASEGSSTTSTTLTVGDVSAVFQSTTSTFNTYSGTGGGGGGGNLASSGGGGGGTMDLLGSLLLLSAAAFKGRRRKA
jgi:hypothetical protein